MIADLPPCSGVADFHRALSREVRTLAERPETHCPFCGCTRARQRTALDDALEHVARTGHAALMSCFATAREGRK